MFEIKKWLTVYKWHLSIALNMSLWLGSLLAFLVLKLAGEAPEKGIMMKPERSIRIFGMIDLAVIIISAVLTLAFVLIYFKEE